MLRSLTATTRDLGPHINTLEMCIRRALAEFVADYAGKRHKLTKRSEASIINDLMVNHCEGAFGSARDNGGAIGVHRSGNRRLVLFEDGQYQVKLKKLDAGLRTRNIQTQSVFNFIWQAKQMTFEEIPEPTNLHAGYQLVEDAALTTARIWITCPNGDTIGWQTELTAAIAEADAAKEITEVRAIHSQPAAARRARVKPDAVAKRSKAAKKKADGDDNGRRGPR
jgi:hypothetical protein